MKRRRIDIHNSKNLVTVSVVLSISEEYAYYFVADYAPEFWWFAKNRKFFIDGTTEYTHETWDTYLKSKTVTWKPHEYRQEARQSCLFAYWFLKRMIGKDPAGIIAKFVYSTRFEEIWEDSFCVSKMGLQKSEK